MFKPVESSVSLPKLEEKIIHFWKERQIYEKSLAARAGARRSSSTKARRRPTACRIRATASPGRSRTSSPATRPCAAICCERKAGWDTHGLPVEVEVCKELGIHAKEEIEAFGVEPFIHKCVESVFRYTQQWEQLTERLGFWIHLDEAYVTYHQSYVESVWWALKTLFDRGPALPGAQDRLVVGPRRHGPDQRRGGPGLPRSGRPERLRAFPAGRSAAASLRDTDLLVWTTTPWTLPSNHSPPSSRTWNTRSCAFDDEPRKLIMASALVETDRREGRDGVHRRSDAARRRILIGLRYRAAVRLLLQDAWANRRASSAPAASEHVAWRVVAADFVTIDTGTGIVHQAPAFGEVDFDVLQAEQARFVDGAGPASLSAPSPPTASSPPRPPTTRAAGSKTADRDIIRNLKARGLLFHQEQYLHDYPFCWRAEEDPLIQYPRKSWFIRTTQFHDQMLANNRQINWLPEHIRDGRFGNFLESNVDWALSRERYWGTPLPIWVCEETGHMEAVGCYEELLAKPGVTGTKSGRRPRRPTRRWPTI